MKKYNNVANQLGFVVVFVNILFPIMVISIVITGQGIDMILGSISFALIIIMTNWVYFYLLDQWYFTYYDEHHIVQKWFKKRKRIDFDKVKYMYFIDNLVILTEKQFDIPTQKINIKTNRTIKRTLKNEMCIAISVYDRLFPKILLGKCINAVKIDIGLKEKIYREMFELDTATGLE